MEVENIKGVIKELLKEVTFIQCDIIMFRFDLINGREMMLEEVGERYRISRDSVR